jgi:GTP-binding protein LepA
MAELLLQVERLSRRFALPSPRGAQLHAVDDVSLHIAPGESLGLVGESGCGKSTLVRLLARLLDASQGRIVFDGQDIAALPAAAFARHALRPRIQMVFQDPTDSLNPRFTARDTIAEPWIKATILTPDEYLGAVIKLCQDRRGVQRELSYVGSRAMVIYDLPLNEVVFDFYDRLKSVSKGYASFDYQVEDYRVGDLVKMSILVNAEPVDALSMLVHRDRAEARGRGMVEKMKDLINPHMFQIPLQAAIGGRIIARETIRALRKDVTAKCYGGDMSRKRKLLDKQKAGKKRMRQFGKVDIPQEAFIAALKMDAD